MKEHAIVEPIPIDADWLNDSIQKRIAALGEGRTYSVAYDTAWMARLATRYPGCGFDDALDWLRENQRDDGSWGGEFTYYHDRVVCTLSALIALKLCGDVGDTQRIRAGEQYLWREFGRLHYDASDTIAFPLIVMSLVRQALAAGLDVPDNIQHNVRQIEQKLNLLSGLPEKWRHTSVSFSMEAAFPYVQPDAEAFERAQLVLPDGLIAASPAATAAYLLELPGEDPQALQALQALMKKQGDGGSSDVKLEIFEIAWSLNHLRMAGAITPDMPMVREKLDHLWEIWSPDGGASYSRYFPVHDLDDTAEVFALLKWGGYDVSADIFARYEIEDYFICLPGEANHSLSANVRTLSALGLVKTHPKLKQWRDKISRMLRHHDLNHGLLFDKWHLSPYYLTGVAICSPTGIIDDLLKRRVKWIVKTQRNDGGWGHYHRSTLEETAYALHALIYWSKNVEPVDPAILDAAAQFLSGYDDDTRFPSMWIGKCAYTPVNVVRSAILAALYSYYRYRIG